MKRLLPSSLGAIALLASSATALADPPPSVTFSTDTISCQLLDYHGALMHSSAVLACDDAQDGVGFRLHQLGDDFWLEVLTE